MSRPIPKQHHHLPHSTDHGEYEHYWELEDVDALKAEINRIADHVRDAWYDDEMNRALATLANINFYLDTFAVLAQAHRDRVVGS